MIAIKLNTKRSPFIMALYFISAISLNAQINSIPLGNSTYSYESDYSDETLHFYLYDDGYHSFSPNNTHQYDITTVPASPVVFTSSPYDPEEPPEESIDGGNTGVVNADIPDYTINGSIELKRSWNLTKDRENYFILMLENKFSSSPADGCVEFHYNNNNTSIDAVDILDHYRNWFGNINLGVSEYFNYGYTHKFVWTFENLAPNEQRFIYLPALNLADVFSKVDVAGVLKVENCNRVVRFNDANNMDILSSIVSNYPHDPNCIIPNPYGLYTCDVDQTVDYRIYFQNEGIDPVQDVYIETICSAPMESVTLLDASHSCTLLWNGQNGFRVDFQNIFLPGTNQTNNPPASYDETIGWVDVGICYHLREFSQQQIDCSTMDVDIFFDTQPPISTSNTICRDLVCDQPQSHTCPRPDITLQVYQKPGVRSAQTNYSQEIDLKLYPNPTEDFIQIDFEDVGFGTDQLSLNIFDAQNRKVIHRNINSSGKSYSIDITELDQGYYILVLKSNQKQIAKSFIKI